MFENQADSVLFPASVVGSMPRTDVVKRLLSGDESLSAEAYEETMASEIQRVVALQERAGLDVVTDLCDQLRCAGVPGLHFYTMNQATTVKALCERLGW